MSLIRIREFSRLCHAIFLWGGIFLITLVMFLFIYGPAIIFFGLLTRQKIVHYWGKIIIRFTATSMQVFDANFLDSFMHQGKLTQSLIIVANHKSWIDIPILAAILPCRFVFVAKKSLFNIPVVGLILSRAGYIPVDRKNTRESSKSLKMASKAMDADHFAVIIFPEGTRTLPDEQMAAFKTGAFLLAKRQGIPILPIVIKGAHNIIPAKQKHWIQRFGNGSVTIRFLRPLQAKELMQKPLGNLKKEVVVRMQAG